MEKWKSMTFPDFYFLGKIIERNINIKQRIQGWELCALKALQTTSHFLTSISFFYDGTIFRRFQQVGPKPENHIQTESCFFMIF